MDWEYLLKPEVQDFIKSHENSDVRDLALKRSPNSDWPYSLILDQIKVRQRAKVKTPDLLEKEGFIFPSSHTFEQASSTACAKYKAQLAGKGDVFVDLTAGGGVDAFYIVENYSSAVLVELDGYSAAVLKHNMPDNVDVHNGDSVDYVEKMGKVDLVFVDPGRRDGTGRKALYDLSSSSPDITKLLPVLARKTKKLIIKTSPFLDISKAIGQLGQHVVEVHVVEWAGDCKEVLYVLDFSTQVEEPIIKALVLDDSGKIQKSLEFIISEEKMVEAAYSMPEKYIYEPSPAFQKAGAFKTISSHYGAHKLHPDTHLYTSNDIIKGFPGKRYKFIGIFPVKPKVLSVKQADLAVRNFPSDVKSLRRKLKIEDGGELRVYATTTCDNKRRLLLCSKESI